MKTPLLLGAAIGYVLGARAGRERYEQIVAFARKVGGSQTVQSTAGVLQAQVDGFAGRARTAVEQKLQQLPSQLTDRLPSTVTGNRVNGSAGH